jgi:hypothetical protein
MSANPNVNVGAWNGDLDQLQSTLLSGRGSDTDAPEHLRFLVAARRTALRREREPDCEFDRPAAIVLVPPDFFESPPPGLTRRPLLNNGNYPLTGQVHFVNVAVAGQSLEYVGDEGALFDLLVATRVDALPTVIYAPKAGGLSKLSWYPDGVRDDTKVVVVPVAVEEPTAQRILQAVNGVYEGHLKTPDQVLPGTSPWFKPAQGWAAKDAEKIVQQAVKIGLYARFSPQCRIKAEQPDKDGRTDIEVVGEFGATANSVTNFAVLELKILREKGSTGAKSSHAYNATHIKDGVNQAYTYGADRHFRERLLCCFDMRATNAGASAVFEPIQSEADTLGIHLGFWFLYRSSEHYRDCKVAAALKAG